MGLDFAARSCCDLDLQGSDQNVVRNMSSQYGDHFCEKVFKSDSKWQSYGPDTFLLQGHAVTLTVKEVTRQVISIWWSFLWNSFKIKLHKTKLWGRHDFAARSCCDLDLQGSDLNLAHDLSSQYGVHYCEIVLKSDFKQRIYGSDTILLQGHAVTLTFTVATQIFCVTCWLNMAIIFVK